MDYVKSCAIRAGGIALVDWPPPLRYGLTRHAEFIRNALWAIEGGLGGSVEWAAVFGADQCETILMAHRVAYKLPRKRAKQYPKTTTKPVPGQLTFE